MAENIKRRYAGMKIDRAAVCTCGGKVFSVPQPGRHADVFRLMQEEGELKPIGAEQGFLLTDGRFVRRIPAKHIAREAGQLLPHAMGFRELFSEDVW